ncbi:hypothetical protein ABZS95_36890 [Streptomyces sp. NPDC005479]|uniref:hypothetical protein n=1 Tax=Streptomyces sp. NPDC005479 TaxID=3154879 RepID=UPI0033B7E720
MIPRSAATDLIVASGRDSYSATASAVLDTDPDRHWHPRDLARQLGDVTLSTMRRQLDRWASNGLIHKAGPAAYTSQGTS